MLDYLFKITPQKQIVLINASDGQGKVDPGTIYHPLRVCSSFHVRIHEIKQMKMVKSWGLFPSGGNFQDGALCI